MKPLKNVPASLTMNFTFNFVMDSGRTYGFTIPAVNEVEAALYLLDDLNKMRAVLLPE